MAEQTLFKNALTNILSTNPFVGDGFKYNDIYVNNTNREAILKEEIEKGIATAKAELDRERRTLDEERRALNEKQQQISKQIASGIEDERKNLIAYRKQLLEADITRKLQASLQADKDAAEITRLNHELDEKSKALVEAEAKIRALEVETEKQKQQIDTLTNSNNVNTDLKNQLDNIVNENKKLEASIVKCEADLVKCEADLAKCEEEKDKCKEEKAQCDKENAELLRRLRLCETENDDLTEKNNNLMKELDDLTQDYRTYYAETVIKLEACRKHIVALNNRNTTNRDSLHDLVAATLEIAALKDVITDIQQKFNDCKAEILRLRNDINQLEQHIQQCQASNAVLQGENQRLDAENQNLNNQLQALQQNQNQLQQELAILQANHKQLVEELARKTIECQATIEQNDKDCFEQIVQRELIIQNLTDKLNQAPTDDYKREYATEFLKVAALTKALQQAKFEHNIAIILQSTAYQDALNAQPKNSVTLDIQNKLNKALLKKQQLLAKADKNKALLEEQIGCAIRLENQKLDYEGQIQELSNVLNNIKQVYPNSNVELLHNPNP